MKLFNLYQLAVEPDLPFTDDSTFILALIILGLSLLYLGISCKYKIFALFSVGIWLHLAIEFSTDTLIAISMVGLMLFSIYITFWGGSNE